jgi:DnaJ-class molecular chaperone
MTPIVREVPRPAEHPGRELVPVAAGFRYDRYCPTCDGNGGDPVSPCRTCDGVGRLT